MSLTESSSSVGVIPLSLDILVSTKCLQFSLSCSSELCTVTYNPGTVFGLKSLLVVMIGRVIEVGTRNAADHLTVLTTISHRDLLIPYSGAANSQAEI